MYIQVCGPVDGLFPHVLFVLGNIRSLDLIQRVTSLCRADFFGRLSFTILRELVLTLHIKKVVLSESKYLCSTIPLVFWQVPPSSKGFWLQSLSCNYSQTQLLGFSVTHPRCSLLCQPLASSPGDVRRVGCTGNQYVSLSLFTAIYNHAAMNPSLTYLLRNVHSAVFLWPNKIFLVSLKINVFIKIYFSMFTSTKPARVIYANALYSSQHKFHRTKHHGSPAHNNYSSK